MVRKSTRVSNTIKSTPKKRVNLSSESENGGGDSSGSDYKNSKKGSANKRRKVENSPSEDDEEDSDEESRPPKVTIIPLPKAREAGDVPYEDGRIHKNTMLFLKDLKANNNREWMRYNDEDFRNAQKDFASFIDQLSELVIEKDPTIPELPSKDIIFRIYRDVRFSQDKTPYKPGGGLWHPEAASLESLRDDIDQSPHRLRRTLMSDGLRRDFFKGAKDEKAAMASFTGMNADSALKTKPKGYEADHKDIKLLRLKNFTIIRKLEDSEITGTNSLQLIAQLIGSMVPFITYLNSVVRPDRNVADSSNGDDDAADEDEE